MTPLPSDRPLRRTLLGMLAAMPALPALAQDRPRGAAPRPVLQLLPDTPRGHGADPLPGNAFPETQRKLWFRVLLGPEAARQTFRARFVAVTTTRGSGIEIAATEAVADAGGTLRLDFSLPRDWPVGDYAIVLARGGQEVATLPYAIQPAAPRNGRVAPTAIEIARLAANGGFDLVDQPQPRDRVLAFLTTLQGARTDGLRVTWTLHAVETTGGAGQVVRSETPRQYVEDTEIHVRVSLPRDWAIGRYRVDLELDGSPAASREFRIAD